MRRAFLDVTKPTGQIGRDRAAAPAGSAMKGHCIKQVGNPVNNKKDPTKTFTHPHQR